MHNIPIIITGFLPNRSEARPQKTAVKAWLKEKAAEVLIEIRCQYTLQMSGELSYGLARRSSNSSSYACSPHEEQIPAALKYL